MIDRKEFDKFMTEISAKISALNGGNPVGLSVVAIWLDEESQFAGSTSTYANFSMTPELMAPVFDSLVRSVVEANIRYAMTETERKSTGIIIPGGKNGPSH